MPVASNFAAASARAFGWMNTAFAATALNPADAAANLVFSNHNLTVINDYGTSTNTSGAVRSTTNRTSGKYYFEVTADAVTTPGFPEFGVGRSTSSLAGELNGQATTTSMAGGATGTCFALGAARTTQVSMAAGDICQVAVDIDNRTLWFRPKGTGNWNNTGGADPATNTGGFAISATGGIYVMASCYDGLLSRNQLTFKFGNNTFVYPIPTGFFPWG